MFRTLVLLLTFAAGAGLQGADVRTAEANLRRVQLMVDAGAAPRSALKAAEDQLQDARNEQVLRNTLYSGNVTERDVPEMLRAAEDLRSRAEQALAAQQKLVAAGVAPERTLARPREDSARAGHQWELAQSRARLVEELAEMAQREAELEERAKTELAIRSDGKGTLSQRDLSRVEAAFYRQFSHPLPVSARGETAVHRSLGFDHRDRYDIALNPDQEEGRWLVNLLKRLQVPFIAFRHAVAGQATGAHIHIGLPSPRG